MLAQHAHELRTGATGRARRTCVPFDRMIMKPNPFSLLLASVLLASPLPCAAEQGTVCLGQLPQRFLQPNAAGGNEYVEFDPAVTYFLQIDELGRVAFSTDAPQTYPALDLSSRHLAKVYENDKLLQSFWFSFDSADSKRLCLWLNTWYWTWNLWSASDGGKKCACQ
jgi:hypothetical protein